MHFRIPTRAFFCGVPRGLVVKQSFLGGEPCFIDVQGRIMGYLIVVIGSLQITPSVSFHTQTTKKLLSKTAKADSCVTHTAPPRWWFVLAAVHCSFTGRGQQ